MLADSAVSLHTERLTLRNFAITDIPVVVKIVSNPNFSGYRQFNPNNLFADVTRFIQDAIKWQQPAAETGLREHWRLAVCPKSNDETLIGYVSLWGWSGKTAESPELGYFIDPDYKGHGYITEAAKCLIKFFQTYNPNKPVFATAHPENIPSQNVLLRLGFKATGATLLETYGANEPRITYRLDFPHPILA